MMIENPVGKRLSGESSPGAARRIRGHLQRRVWIVCSLACSALLVVYALPPVARASKGIVDSVAMGGSPRGVAVNKTTGQVYVAVDGGEAEGINILDSSGELVSDFGSSRGQFEGIAIDQSTGEVYASQAEGQISAFSSTGIFEGTVLDAPGSGAGQVGTAIGYIAVNPTDGNIVVADSSNHRLDEFSVRIANGEVGTTEFLRAIGWGVISNSDNELQECTTVTGCVGGLEGAEAGEFGASGPTRVAVDSSGAIYAVDPSKGRVERFSSLDDSASDFAQVALSGMSPSDVAVEAATNHIYVAGALEGEQQVLELDSTGKQIASPAGVGARISTENGFAVSSLDGNTYMSCDSPSDVVVALNTVAPQSVGATEVAAESATLRAEFNPGDSRLTYRFDYGQSDSYENGSMPPAAVSAGSSEEVVPESVRLQGLMPSTTYHYRVVTTSEPANGAPETFYGSDHHFTTRAAVSQPALLDGRAWELVSPADKHNAAFEAAPREGGVIQASQDGTSITYISYASTESEPQGEQSPEWAQIVSRRGPTQWESKDISPRYDQEWGLRPGHLSAYLAFSEDLSLSLVEPPPGATSRASGAPEPSPYLRDEARCLTAPDACHTPLVSEMNVPGGTKFGGQPGNFNDGASFIDATKDLEHIVLRSEAPLTSLEVEQGLYEWNGGKSPTEQLKLVSVLPESEGGLPVPNAGLGYRSSDVRGAISEDGSRVIWGTDSFLYMRDTVREETILLSEDQGGSGLGEFKPVFQTANADGSKVFFTDEENLTANSSSEYEQPDLYVYEITSKPGEKLSGRVTDLTPVERAGEHAGVQGMVLGASEDGTSVYFVASGVLTGSSGSEGRGAVAGGDNLYLEQYDGAGHWADPRFIATLSREDGGRGGWKGQLGGELRKLTDGVSADGQWLAFMSDRSLTDYDNRDAVSENPDEEVYLYHAGSGVLVCASCNATNARPHGVFDPGSGEGPSLLTDRARVWEGHWLAASLPGWTMHELVGSSLGQPRYLSDGGRLFFDSTDALVRGDANSTQDVYEYEPSGIGTCELERGCLALVSSGVSPDESAFLDAGATGEDVFFLTSEKLLAQSDPDDAYDVYDAHVCSPRFPCLTPPGASPACVTADECRGAQQSQPQLFAAPSTATFSGSGNVVKGPVKSTVQANGKSKPRSCKARAKRIKGSRRRARALRQCAVRSKARSKRRVSQPDAHKHTARHADR